MAFEKRLLGVLVLSLGTAGCLSSGGGAGPGAGAAAGAGASAGSGGSAAGGGAGGGTGASAGIGGSGGTGAEGASANCSGIEITTSGNLDLDAKSALVSGNVTVNGAVFPALPDSRGAIFFENRESGDRVEIPLGTDGPAHYAARLARGHYDIGYAGNSNACIAQAWPLPCNGGAISKDVAIEADGALDLDVPAVKVQGSVGINGQSMPPAAGDRGSLAFRIEGDSSVSTASFGPSGAAAYMMTLLAGSYTVEWDGNGSLCDAAPAPSVPCNDGPVLTKVSLLTDGVLDVNVPAVHVLGTVGINGQPMPSAAGDRGSLEFSLDTGSSIDTQSFGPTGPASYQLTLLAGKYQVSWNGNSSLCESGISPVPCNDGPVQKDVSLVNDGVLDVNVPTVHVQGNARINGQPMPAASGDRGSVEFDIESGSTVSTKSFGPDGPAGYVITLLAGKYRVNWDGNSGLCTPESVSPVPCNDGPVLKDVNLTSDGALDVDVPTVHVQGQVLINNAAMPDATSGRGSLEFSLTDGSSFTTEDFGSSGPAHYLVTLLAGKYDLLFDGNSSLCEAEIPSVVPCNDGKIMSDVALTSDGALDVNVPAVSVQGTLSLDGKPLPDADVDGNRGRVEFRLIGGGTAEARSFLASGPATYQIAMIAGRYVVSLESSSTLCQPGSPLTLPCVSQVLAGCP